AVGLLLSPNLTPEQTDGVIARYRAAGGTGSCMLMRRVWVDRVDPDPDASPEPAWFTSGSPEAVIDQLLSHAEATGADSYNVRVHVRGMDARAVGAQIERIGASVLPALKAGLRARA